MKKISGSLSLIFILYQTCFAFSSPAERGDSTANLSLCEVPGISAGAEYASMLSRAINSGNYSFENIGSQIKEPVIVKGTNLQDNIFSIEGINFEGDEALGGLFHIPPDPIAAAGPSHVISVVNTSIHWYTKAGVTEYSQRLGKNALTAAGSFFEVLSPLTPTFDPKVIYDQYDGRFVVVTLERTDVSNGDSLNTSRILIAVSDNGDPNGIWYFYAIDSKISINGIDHWADYPGLGLDDDAIYLTYNMYEFNADGGDFGGVRLWIFNKNQLYSGEALSINVYDPFTASGAENFASVAQPAHMFGTVPGNVGTFLTYYSGLSNGVSEFVGVIRVDDPLGIPSFTNQFVFIGDIDNTATTTLPDAPQKDTSVTIEVNDRRTLNAVWRDNYLWVTTTLLPSTGSDINQTTAYWFKINTTNINALFISDYGPVGGEDIAESTYTFFPSLAVNGNGDMIIGFAASAPTIYAGAYFAGRSSTDPPGTIGPSGILRSGEDYYIRKFGGEKNRWGDYSGICVDPSDDGIFWVFNEYARSRGNLFSGEDGRWGTAFGQIPVNVVSVDDNETSSRASFSFKLEQNYPNPFNPATKIKYQIPLSPPLLKGEIPIYRDGGLTTLKVYDMLGREVATLVNEEKPAGEYEVEFSAESGSASGGNADKLSSGIYFYTLDVTPLNNGQRFRESKKMILMK
jgi:hypothetical protein